jgi:hypothetical protein
MKSSKSGNYSSINNMNTGSGNSDSGHQNDDHYFQMALMIFQKRF